MKSHLKTLTILLTLGASALLFLHTYVPVSAATDASGRLLFECSSVTATPSVIDIKISDTGFISLSHQQVEITLNLHDPRDTTGELRSSGYRVAYYDANFDFNRFGPQKVVDLTPQLVNGKDWQAKFNLDLKDYYKDITAKDFSNRTIQFRLEETGAGKKIDCNGAAAGEEVSAVEISYDSSQPNVNSVLEGACNSYALWSDAFGLKESHFNCISDSTVPNETRAGESNCYGDDIVNNRNACTTALQNARNQGVLGQISLCMACNGQVASGDNADKVRRDNLKQGEVCTKSSDLGQSCFAAGGQDFRCRQSEQQSATLRCLGANLTLGLSCVKAEKECKPFDVNGGGYAPQRCMPSAGAPQNFGTCNYATCVGGFLPILKDDSCKAQLGATEDAVCIGKDSQTGYCATESELQSLLANSNYVDLLINSLDTNYAKIQESVAQLKADGIEVDDPSKPNSGGNASTPASTEFGKCKCANVECRDNGGKVTQDSSKAVTATVTATDDTVRSDAYACIKCIEAGNTWTDSLGCVTTTPNGVYTTILRIAIGVIGGVALLRAMLLGFQMNFGGKEADIKKSREEILGILGGLGVAIFGILLLRIIGVNILDVVPSGFFGN